MHSDGRSQAIAIRPKAVVASLGIYGQFTVATFSTWPSGGISTSDLLHPSQIGHNLSMVSEAPASPIARKCTVNAFPTSAAAGVRQSHARP